MAGGAHSSVGTKKTARRFPHIDPSSLSLDQKRHRCSNLETVYARHFAHKHHQNNHSPSNRKQTRCPMTETKPSHQIPGLPADKDNCPPKPIHRKNKKGKTK